MSFNSSPAQSRRWLISFVGRYDEARRTREAQAAKRRLHRKNSDTNVELDPTNRFQMNAIDEKRLIDERLKHGYRLKWERHIAGRTRRPFSEEGLRSEKSPVLRLFVARVPKGGVARGSDDKATLYVPYRSKLLTLDTAYIEANKTFLSMIRIDCDGVFSSLAGCLKELQDLVDTGKIPHLPHIIVGDTLDDGSFANPHFIFMLPVGSEVWNDFSDPRCRKEPVRLFDAVSRGLTKGMLSIGVDPAAPRLTQRMKNPLSPIWTIIIPNTSEFMTLKQYAKCVDVKTTHEELARHAAAIQSEMGLTPSNILFNALRARAAKVLRDWHFDADPRMKQSRDALADDLHIALTAYARETGHSDTEMSLVIGNVSSHMAAEFDHRKIGKKKANRHSLMHLVDGVPTVSARQKIGAEHSASVRKSKTLNALVAEYSKALDEGREPSVPELAKAAGVSRAAAYRSFEECRQVCSEKNLSRSIDKKVPTDRPDENIPEPAPVSTSGCTAYPGSFYSIASEETDDDSSLADWMEMNDPALSYTSP